LQVARRTENQKIKLSSPRKPLLKQDDKDSVQKRNKSKVFYLKTDLWLLSTLKIQKVSNRKKTQQQKLEFLANITLKSVNKSQDSHVNKTDLQVARRTENQKIKLSSPRKPLLKQDDKDSVQKRNKSKVFYLIADNVLKKHSKKICIDKSKVQNPKQSKGGF
jgi:hypothetical protein